MIPFENPLESQFCKINSCGLLHKPDLRKFFVSQIDSSDYFWKLNRTLKSGLFTTGLKKMTNALKLLGILACVTSKRNDLLDAISASMIPFDVLLY